MYLWIEGHSKVSQCLFKQAGHPDHPELLSAVSKEERKLEAKAFYLANKEWIDEKNALRKENKRLKQEAMSANRVV